MPRPFRLALLVLLALQPAGARAAPYSFSDVARVDTSCGDTYTTLDNCANKFNPPIPSIQRDLEVPRPTDQDVVVARLDYSDVLPYARTPGGPPAGRTEALPTARTTTDGRLLIRTVYPWALSFVPYRPEDVQHDWKSGPTPALPSRFHEKLHPLIWLDPRNTRWTGLNPGANSGQNPDVPVALHNTICEDNDVAVNAGNRSPRACSATYSVCGGNDQANCANITTQVYAGDCYDITLLVDTSNEAADQWEMRSVDLTVFVPGPKRHDTGDAGAVLPDQRSVLVYPRQPRPADPNPWILPEWSFKEVNGQKNFARGYNPDHEWPNLVDRANLCTNLQPSERPNWCQFLDKQRSRTSFGFDVDGDAVMDAQSQIWNGTGGGRFLFAPVTTGDGRLLVLESGASFGTLYSYSETPCDVGGWRDFYPISHMPHDPRLVQRYDLARAQRDAQGRQHPFRDSLGRDVPYGAHDVGGYPWIDRAGKNLILSVGNKARDGYFAQTVTAPAPCNGPAHVCLNPDRGAGARVAVLGAWTQGKLVVLDNTLNFTDFNGAPNNQADFRFKMRLYADTDVWVTPKGSQQINSFENRMFQYDAHNPSLPFDVVWTLQSDTHHNSELVFDEYHNNRAFVVAHMNSPAEWSTGLPQDGFVATYPERSVRNGEKADFRFKTNPLVQNAATSTKWHAADGVEGPATLRLRGGARVEPVAMGGVLGKGVYLDGNNDFMDMGYKIDPALRDAGWYFGLWIDPRDDLPPTRGNGPVRTIFFFPDKSTIGLRMQNIDGVTHKYELVLQHASNATPTVMTLPRVQRGRYFHLGVHLTTKTESWTETTEIEVGDPPAHSIKEKVYRQRTRARRTAQIYVDGTRIGAKEFVNSYYNGDGAFGFQPMAAANAGGWSWMTVGDPGPALATSQPRSTLKAWIDELRIYALRPDDIAKPLWFDEFICNTALGTLVDVTGTSADQRVQRLKSLATDYGGPSAVCEQLKLETYTEPLDFPPQYLYRLCANRQHKNPDPVEGHRCLRNQQLGLDAAHKLAWNVRRPNFSDLPFCTSCHVADHPLQRHANNAPIPGGLGLDALFIGAVGSQRWNDLRRQPMNVPATLSGSIGSHWPVPLSSSPTQPVTLPPSPGDVFILDSFFDLQPKLRPYP